MSRNHLKYESLDEWAANLPEDWMNHPNAAKRDRWYQQFTELKKHLWDNHISSLSDSEQAAIKDGTHPSQSHRSGEIAQQYASSLSEELLSMGHQAKVEVVAYHGDRNILLATVDCVGSDQLDFPWLYRGFEVRYRTPCTE